MTTLFINIKQLVQVRDEKIDFLAGANMKILPFIENAYLEIENDNIVDFGKMENKPNDTNKNVVDCTGKVVLPSWIDSHTHIVYAGNRVNEFVDRINGLSYEEIANKGGGILNSAKKLQETSEEVLYEQSRVRLEEIIQLGTGAVEIKSGYGLTPAAELKMLRVIKRLQENYPLPIKATFLAAHALPTDYKTNKKAFLDQMIQEVLPVIAEENLASYIDVFCEEGYFSVADLERLLEAGKHYGLIPKVHVNQFTILGGVKTSVAHQALSVDHLEMLHAEDIAALQNSQTMPTALPRCIQPRP